uniref:Ribosomal protein eL8/eL30/eS12/Gadd45 domain-containing protein n=1 Tax=Clastoptera arizonana TaxID=38151 RepID=A0A1B6DWE9_9HEMI
MASSEDLFDESPKSNLENNSGNSLNFGVIAHPLAPRKLTKKIHKLVKKAHAEKDYLRCGLKSVQTRILKGEKGIVIFAADVFPIDIMVHMPAVCEENDIPYCYTPSREALGLAMGVQRSTIMVLIREKEDYKELYDEVLSEISALPVPLH